MLHGLLKNTTYKCCVQSVIYNIGSSTTPTCDYISILDDGKCSVLPYSLISNNAIPWAVGIVIGVSAVIIPVVIFVGIYCCYVKRQRSKRKTESSVVFTNNAVELK